MVGLWLRLGMSDFGQRIAQSFATLVHDIRSARSVAGAATCQDRQGALPDPRWIGRCDAETA